jgi:hypothetical protein
VILRQRVVPCGGENEKVVVLGHVMEPEKERDLQNGRQVELLGLVRHQGYDHIVDKSALMEVDAAL